MLNLDTVKRLDVWTQRVEQDSVTGNLDRLVATRKTLKRKLKDLYSSAGVLNPESTVIILGRIGLLDMYIKRVRFENAVMTPH